MAEWWSIEVLHGETSAFGWQLTYESELIEAALTNGARDATWFSDTWLFDAKGWHQALIAAPPAARFGHTLAYHPGLQSVVMIGGAGGKDVSGPIWYYDFRRETWLWNGQTWTQQFPAVQPGPAFTIGAAYDDTIQALTVHVGDDLTCLSRGPKTYLLTGPAQ